MKAMIFAILIGMGNILYAQEFNVAHIPDSLLANASVVKRYEELTLDIKSPSKYLLHERHVYTIMDEQGDPEADYTSYYDKFTTIDYCSATLYGGNGKEIRHLRKKDMPDNVNSDGISIIEDDRHISNNFSYRIYPYTVDYEEDDTEDGVLDFDGWAPVFRFNMSVEYSRYVIVAPDDYQVRYKQLNFNLPPVITEKGGRKTYTWEMRNIPAQKAPLYAPRPLGAFPVMMVAPSDFEAQGYKGNMSNWKNYGLFINQLKKGRDMLPEEVKKQVHLLTDQIKDPKQKIALLYDFLQKNTHYISVQLGIGGWQPFDANYVGTKKYGDCKALSNYMVALLKEAGIMGKYVEIRAGANALPIERDFSESQFNHVICCVPFQNDTVWLECTSQNDPAGYLGSFTADRWGVLIDDHGGTLVHTPRYDYAVNVETTRLNATVDNDGNLTAANEVVYNAVQQDELSLRLSYVSDDEATKYLKNSIDIPTYDITHLHFVQSKKLLPSITAIFNLTAPNYAQVTGKRFFIYPNVLSKFDEQLTEEQDRKYAVELLKEETKIDTVEIQIPKGYAVESPFVNVNIRSKFGTFTASAIVADGKITYYRRQEYFSGKFPASDYASLVTYFHQIYKSDHSKIVLAKNE